MRCLPRKPQTRSVEQERGVLQGAKLKGQSHPGPLTLDMELQDVEFALLDTCNLLFDFTLGDSQDYTEKL